jgi:hypothetical protein
VTDTPAARAAAIDPHRPALTVAAALLGAALQRNNGHYEPTAMALVIAALAVAWAAVLAPRALGRVVPDRPRLVAALLAVVLLGQIVVIVGAPIGMYFARPMPAQHPGFVPGLAVAGLCAVTALAGLLAATVVLGVLTYRGSPHPVIDVVTVHDEAFAALGRGESPYRMSFPDVYQGQQDFYPPGMVEDGRVQYGFPYPPLSLLMAWPGHRLGDFRYAELAALVLGAAALAAAGRTSAVAVLAMGVLLFTPRGFFALEQSWTEPFAILWIGLAVWAASARQPLLAGVALGLAIATKQYLVLAAPMLWHLADTPARRRDVLVVAAATAVTATLPALADPQGFFHSAVMVQVREVLRMDALSLAVPLARTTGTPLPGIAYAALVLTAALLAAWRAPSTPAGATAAFAVTALTAFAFGKKAFCNYYVLVIAALVMAIAARRADDDPRPAARG